MSNPKGFKRDKQSFYDYILSNPPLSEQLKESSVFNNENESNKEVINKLKKNFGSLPFEFLSEKDSSELNLPRIPHDVGSRRRNITFQNSIHRPRIPSYNAFGIPEFRDGSGVEYKVATGDFVTNYMKESFLTSVSPNELQTVGSDSEIFYEKVMLYVRIPRSSSRTTDFSFLREGKKITLSSRTSDVLFTGEVSEIFTNKDTSRSSPKTTAIVVKNLTPVGLNVNHREDRTKLKETNIFNM